MGDNGGLSDYKDPAGKIIGVILALTAIYFFAQIVRYFINR